jgi:hypothetical protein
VSTQATDWVAWHDRYSDAGSSLARRLVVVRRLIGRAVEDLGDPIRVLSLCSGDGRDVLPVLGAWRTRRQVSGRLIELNPQLAEGARVRAAEHGLEGVEVVCGDAASRSSYVGAAPADLVVACGIFGNITDDDVHGFIATLPMLCAAGAFVVWTRHRREPDLTPRIRGWLADAGFAEVAVESPGPDQFAVGLYRLAVAPPTFVATDVPLFTFVR